MILQSILVFCNRPPGVVPCKLSCEQPCILHIPEIPALVLLALLALLLL
jgi:hypothetical protein